MKSPKTLLRVLRREREWSLDDVAVKTGIHPSALSRIERRLRRPSADQLAKLAQVFSVKRDELVA